MAEKSCDTCLYGIKTESGKKACTYSGICLSPLGERTAYRPNKATEYAEFVGRKFKPTFESNIDHFEIRGYDAERDMVLTIAHPKKGEPFDDEIEERYLIGAFETGDYKVIDENPWAEDEKTFQILAQPYLNMMGPVVPRKVKFSGPSCSRCVHRFGTTSNRYWCADHYKSEKCFRFKFDR